MAGPLVVADAAGMESSTPQKVGQDTFVSWGIRNAGNEPLDVPYFVDLSIDGVVVNRWTGISLAAEEIVSLLDWPRLNVSIAPTPGPHVVKLVVDSTNLIAETDETDNTLRDWRSSWRLENPFPPTERPVCPSARPRRRPDARNVGCHGGKPVRQ